MALASMRLAPVAVLTTARVELVPLADEVRSVSEFPASLGAPRTKLSPAAAEAGVAWASASATPATPTAAERPAWSSTGRSSRRVPEKATGVAPAHDSAPATARTHTVHARPVPPTYRRLLMEADLPCPQRQQLTDVVRGRAVRAGIRPGRG